MVSMGGGNRLGERLYQARGKAVLGHEASIMIRIGGATCMGGG